MPEKRNIVMITLDSVRADHCSFTGYERKTTPTIDRMARKGLCFENAIASSVPTLSSMFGVFTGTYALLNSDSFTGKNGRQWRVEFHSRKTLASVLSKKGYTTKAFTANPFASEYFGMTKGFESLYDPAGERSKENLRRENPLAARGLLETGSRFILKNLKDFIVSTKVLIKRERLCTPWEKFYPIILNEAEKSEEPYFFWILLIDTHIPWIPKVKTWSRSQFWNIYLSYKILRSVGKCNLSKKERQKIIDAYDDSIKYADLFIERLWRDLEDQDPIFIIHSDHGEGFGEHGLYSHFEPLLYEEFVHVPLVIYNADIKERVERPVSLLGMGPAILELINEENEFPYKSFLNGGEDYVISKAFDRGKRKLAIRTKNWKYIIGHKDVDELYDLRRDPHERENVFEQHIELAKELRKIADLHIKQEEFEKKIREKIQKIRNLGVI